MINMEYGWFVQEWSTSINGEHCILRCTLSWAEDWCSVDELALPGGPGPGLIIPTHITCNVEGKAHKLGLELRTRPRPRSGGFRICLQHYCSSWVNQML